MQPATPLQAVFLGDLAAALCRAQGPPQALLAAAAAVHQQLPSLAFIGVAVLAQDRQSVKYSVLHNTQQGAARLGAVAASNCAACLAIDTKQVVHVRDMRHGDLGFHDLQYFQQEHEARACYVVPLVVAQNALGALSIAATQADAFNGHEPWLQVVAAMCAPYLLLLRSHEGLLALEGLVSQVLPMRVALQLQDQHRYTTMQDMPHGSSEQQQLLPITGTATDPNSTGEPGQGSAAASAPAIPVADADPSSTAAGSAAHMDASPPTSLGSSLRHLRARQRAQQQERDRQQHPEHARQHHQQQQPGLLAATVPMLPAGQLQQQLLAAHSWTIGASLDFQPLRLEQAYQTWALQQWLRLLDGIFLLLVVLSAFSGTVHRCLSTTIRLLQPWPAVSLSDRQLNSCIGSCVLLLLVAWLLLKVQQLPAHLYLRWRVPAVAVLRVSRTVLLVADLLRLQLSSAWLSTNLFSTNSSSSAASGGGSLESSLPLRSSGPTAAVVQAAACSLLLMLGLLGQLPAALHAVVQAGCVGLVFAALVAMNLAHVAGVHTGSRVAGVLGEAVSSMGSAGWTHPVVLLVACWVLPVAWGAAVDWYTRRCFLRKIS